MDNFRLICPKPVVANPPTTLFRMRERLQNILENMPARVKEARRVITKIYSDMDMLAEKRKKPSVLSEAWTQFEHRSPVTVDISVLLGEQWKLTKGFKTFLNPENGHLSLKLLPLDVTFKVAADILKITSSDDSEYSNRITGGMGIGKSHGVFLVLIHAIGFWEHVGPWITFDPLDCLTEPGKKRLIEQLVVMMHRFDHKVLLDALAPLYAESHMYEANEFVKKAFSACYSLCLKRGLKFIKIVDQENRLYAEDRGSSTAALADSLSTISHTDISIFISSASSSEVSPKNETVALYQVPRDYLLKGNNTASIYFMFENDRSLWDSERGNLRMWVRYFGGKGPFVEALEEHSRGCPLETHSIIRHFLSTPFYSTKDDPWTSFLEPDVDDVYEHHKFMKTLFSCPEKSIYKKIYALLMRMLDYHITADAVQAEVAGVWLWGRLRRILKRDDYAVEKFLLRFIDARYLSIEENKTPAAFTSRAAIILRSLDSTDYMDASIARYMLPESLELPPILQDLHSNFNTVQGHLMERKIYGLFNHFWCVKMQSIIPYNPRDKNAKKYAKLMDGLEIIPAKRRFISLKTIMSDMKFILSSPIHSANAPEWTFLIPVHNFFPMIDFAMLFRQGNGDPPVLFPIQVTYTITSHATSDREFAEGTIKKNQLHIHPLMEAFNVETKGKGRVQFIWAGMDQKDLAEALSHKKFHEHSWFTNVKDWVGLTESFSTPTPVSLRDIGYSCGVAVSSARANAARILEEKKKNIAPEPKKARKGHRRRSTR